jgi:hypothetical protein
VEVCIIQKKYQKGNPDADCLFGSHVEFTTAGSNFLKADLEMILG